MDRIRSIRDGAAKPLKVSDAAQKLGVHRTYLSAVLNGRMKSIRLLRRYIELQRQHFARAASLVGMATEPSSAPPVRLACMEITQ